MADVDLFDRDAKRVGGDLSVSRVVALAVVVSADIDAYSAGRVDLDLGRLGQHHAAGRRSGDRAGPQAADLDPGRKTDADELALLAGFRLLAPHLVVAEQLQRLVEAGVVIAGVHDQPEVLRERELLFVGKVLAAQLDGVHLQLDREQIDHPLRDVGGLGSSCTAVRVGRDLVGEHADRTRRDGLPLVGAAREQAGACLEGSEGADVGAAVKQLGDAHAEERAVLLGRGLHVIYLSAAGIGVLHRFGAGLGPFDRSLDQLGHRRHEVVLGVGADLGTETAADVMGDDAHRVLAHPQRARHEQPDPVRVLRGHPHGQALVERVVLRHDDSALDRVRR